MVKVLATTVSILSQKGSNFLSLRRRTSCLRRYPVLPLNSNRDMFSCMGKSESKHSLFMSPSLSSPAEGGAVIIWDARHRQQRPMHALKGTTLTCSGEKQKLRFKKENTTAHWKCQIQIVTRQVLWTVTSLQSCCILCYRKSLSGCISIYTHRLVVECHHLAACIPKRLWVVIGWVHSCSFGVNSTHLSFVVSGRDCWGSIHLYHCIYMYHSILFWLCETIYFGWI